MTNREIDAQVVEHITGGWFTSHRMEYRWLCCCGYAKGMGMIPAGMSLSIGTEGSGQIPHYSTDPVASKQLRDRMRADGFVVEMFNRLDGTTWAWIHPDDESEDNPRNVAATTAESEELAFALAALAAKGKPVQEVK